MNDICLHLYSPGIADRYIAALRGEVTPEWSWWHNDLPEFLTREISEIEANRLTSGIALAMASELPTFHHHGCGLTPWEALFDRGIGMYMRPPARIFVDHGHNPYLIDKMPIRLDMQGATMTGAWVPPHLIPNLASMIDERLERWAKRIHDAEYDPYPLLATLHMATQEALQRGLGLIESMDVLPPGAQVVQTPGRKQMDRSLRDRIDLAIAEERKGIMDRLFKRGS